MRRSDRTPKYLSIWRKWREEVCGDNKAIDIRRKWREGEWREEIVVSTGR